MTSARRTIEIDVATAEALLSSDAVTGSVPPEFPEAFEKNIENRGAGALAWQIMQGAQAAE